MQKRKPVGDAPMLYQLTIFEAANVEDIEVHGFAAVRFLATGSHPNPNCMAHFHVILDCELQAAYA